MRERVAVVIVVALAAAASGCTPTGVRTGGTPGSAPESTTATTAGEGPAAPAPGPGVTGSTAGTAPATATAPAACRRGDPLADVYHPDRLTVVSACMTVGGTVMSVRHEDDGDTHFDLALDARWTSLLKPANLSAQHGWLVAEIVPADKPGCAPGQPPRPAHGSYDYGLCSGAAEPDPAIGSHVYVTGPYVIDEDHGGWAEIHPVWAVAAAPAG